MSLPAVVIVGRPNVGKSTLFNAIVRRRIAIEEATAGVTRDRVGAVVEHLDKRFELFDTGGIGIEDSMGLDELVERQIQFAIDGSTILVFVTDIKAGVTPLDVEVAGRLRRLETPILLVANKCDSAKDELSEGDLFQLGFGPPILCSALQLFGRTDLLDAIVEMFPEGSGEEIPPEPVMKLAVVGKRNAGKSTLINALAKEERVIVSEVPGTTRDSVDVLFELDGKQIMAIDTAGIRRMKSIEDSIEFYSFSRARSSIRRADVVFLMFDVTRDISKIEKQLASEIFQEEKPCVLVVNKWDLAKGISTAQFVNYVRAMLPGALFAPVSFISAETHLNMMKTVRLGLDLYKQAGQRVNTGELNRVLEKIAQKRSPRVQKNKIGRIYYGTQTDIHPPTFCLFVNDRSLFDDEYMRYVERSLRDKFPFTEIPLRLLLRNAK